MKNKGFTLIELLATVVILGIIMVIAIPNVTGILQKNKAKSYYEDAKKLVTLAEYKMRGNSSVTRPNSTGDCLVMNLYYLDNSEFENAPNGGSYDKKGSFVVIKRVTVGGNVSYKYYVRLLEIVDGSYRGIRFMESSDLYKDVDLTKIENVAIRFDVDTSTPTNKDTAKTNINGLSPSPSCSSILGNYAKS